MSEANLEQENQRLRDEIAALKSSLKSVCELSFPVDQLVEFLAQKGVAGAMRLHAVIKERNDA